MVDTGDPYGVSQPMDGSQDAPVSGLKYITEGNDWCGTVKGGALQSMHPAAWVWLGILVIGAAGQLLSIAAGDKKEPRKVIVVSVFLVSVALINIYIFYKHAHHCNAWVGFGVTFLISILASMINCTVLPGQCQTYTPSHHSPSHHPDTPSQRAHPWP